MPGTKIYLSAKNARGARKLDALWQGPYVVKGRLSEVNYSIELPGARKHKVFHVSLLKRAPESTELAKDHKGLFDEEFEVEAIRQQRIRRGRREYLVKWKGYTEVHST